MYKVNQDTYARVFSMLLADPITAHEAAEETGMHYVTAQSLMRTLKKHKVVHVSGWEADALGRDTTPIYKLGRGRDKPRHKFTAAERQARSREKKRKLALQEACNGLRSGTDILARSGGGATATISEGVAA